MKLTITVTEENVNKGVKNCTTACPVVLALFDALKRGGVESVVEISVTRDLIEIKEVSPGNQRFVCRLVPGIIAGFISDYDRDLPNSVGGIKDVELEFLEFRETYNAYGNLRKAFH